MPSKRGSKTLNGTNGKHQPETQRADPVIDTTADRAVQEAAAIATHDEIEPVKPVKQPSQQPSMALSAEERRMSRVRRKLAAQALKLMESLDAESIAVAPLNQRAAALGIVLDRLVKLQQVETQLMAAKLRTAAARDQANESEVIRIEYQYPDGSIHHTPLWADDGDAGDAAPSLPRRGLWETFWQNGGGEELTD